MSEDNSQPSITKERAEEILRALREMLCLQGYYRVWITIMADDIDQVNALAADHGERMQVYGEDCQRLIYSRTPFSKFGIGLVEGHIDFTAASIRQLPSEETRARARELLGLEVEA